MVIERMPSHPLLFCVQVLYLAITKDRNLWVKLFVNVFMFLSSLISYHILVTGKFWRLN